LFSGATGKISNPDLMYETYRNLADRHGIPILDYTDMWICHDTTYFYNAMHLNKAGAEIYTDSLANDVKRLGIL
jgi:lysophospholipase L1-like esterase